MWVVIYHDYVISISYNYDITKLDNKFILKEKETSSLVKALLDFNEIIKHILCQDFK